MHQPATQQQAASRTKKEGGGRQRPEVGGLETEVEGHKVQSEIFVSICFSP